MNARIYKKQAKRCIELLRVWGGWGDMTLEDKNIELLRRKGRGSHPILTKFCNGTPVIWYRCSYEYNEWDTKCPRDSWIDLHYWEHVVPDDFTPNFDIEGDGLPVITLAQARERFSTRMLPKGWRWRGKRVVRTTGRKN